MACLTTSIGGGALPFGAAPASAAASSRGRALALTKLCQAFEPVPSRCTCDGVVLERAARAARATRGDGCGERDDQATF